MDYEVNNKNPLADIDPYSDKYFPLDYWTKCSREDLKRFYNDELEWKGCFCLERETFGKLNCKRDAKFNRLLKYYHILSF